MTRPAAVTCRVFLCPFANERERLGHPLNFDSLGSLVQVNASNGRTDLIVYRGFFLFLSFLAFS